MTQYALDTSILLRWFSQYHDADTDRALRLRQEQQEERVRITILDTTLCELAHILKEANRFSQGDIDAALASLEYMHIQVVPYQASLARRAVQIAYEHDISVYSAGFIALGADLRCQAITCDRTLYTKVANLPWTSLLSTLNF